MKCYDEWKNVPSSIGHSSGPSSTKCPTCNIKSTTFYRLYLDLPPDFNRHDTLEFKTKVTSTPKTDIWCELVKMTYQFLLSVLWLLLLLALLVVAFVLFLDWFKELVHVAVAGMDAVVQSVDEGLNHSACKNEIWMMRSYSIDDQYCYMSPSV
jgi:hypothetical protein